MRSIHRVLVAVAVAICPLANPRVALAQPTTVPVNKATMAPQVKRIAVNQLADRYAKANVILKDLGQTPQPLLKLQDAFVVPHPIGDSTAPATLGALAEMRDKQEVVLMKDDVRFDGEVYELSRWLEETPETSGRPPVKRFVLLADTLRLSGKGLRIGLNGPNRFAGGRQSAEMLNAGDVVIVARRIVRSGGAQISIDANGGKAEFTTTVRDHRGGPDPKPVQWKRHLAGRGGNVSVWCERYEVNGRETPLTELIAPADAASSTQGIVTRLTGGTWPDGTTDVKTSEAIALPATRRVRPEVRLPAERIAPDGEARRVGVSPELAERVRVDVERRPITEKLPLGTDGKGASGEAKLAARPADVVAAPRLVTWQMDVMNHLRIAVTQAALAGDDAEVLRVVRRIRTLIALKLTPPTELAEAFLERLHRLQEARDNIVLPLIVRTDEVTGTPSGVPAALSVFIENGNPDVRLGPTHALIQPQEVDGRVMMGVLRRDDQNPEIVTLEFDLKLSVDPWLASLLDGELTLREERRRDGRAFDAWTLAPRKPNLPGVLDFETTKQGDVLRCKLRANTQLAGTAFIKLASDVGLPIEFDWTYAGNAAIKSSEPLLVGLTRTRWSDPRVTVVDGAVTNGGTMTATVAYVQVGRDQFFPPVGAGGVRLAAGESAKLSAFALPARVDAAAIRVPAEAVTLAVDAFSFDGFQLDESTVEKITVRNLLPAVDPVRQTNLRNIEFRLCRIVQDGGAPPREDPPTDVRKLAPFGSEASELTIPILKLGRGKATYRLEATAYYTNGGHNQLKPKTFDGPVIDIEPGLLPD